MQNARCLAFGAARPPLAVFVVSMRPFRPFCTAPECRVAPVHILPTWCLGTAVAALLTACGGSDASLKVSAASSLKTALVAYDGDAAYSFAGSDDLAAQLRGGARPSVFAAANAKLPDQLFAEGLVERPVAFARNRLVLAVPVASDARALADVAGAPLAVGAAGVPVGDYTRAVLDRLPDALRRALLRGVRTEEPDVAGIVGKLTQGAVDGGFVYATDVRAAGGALRAIALPRAVQPEVVYKAAVVRGAPSTEAARAFVRGLPGAPALREAGFLPPP